MEKITDIVYAVVDGLELRLDLYLPDDTQHARLLVWVHGGAWRRGSKDQINTAFVADGYAMASLEFRLSEDAPFPAQVHDIKAAVRFLRHAASGYGYDATRVGILGVSSGGHLAALVGATNGDAELEGTVGDYPDQSSDVQVIVSYFGASNLTTILQQSTPFGLGVRVPALQLLLGGLPHDKYALARLASPVFHVDAGAPPLLLVHGDQDPQMPINQSHELHHVFQRHNVPVRFEVLHGAAHGGDQFFDLTRNSIVREFLGQYLG